MFFGGNNTAAKIFDTVSFNTESAVHVFEVTAAEKAITAIGVEVTYEAHRRNYSVTAMSLCQTYLLIAQGTPHDRVLDFILSIAWDTGA